MGEHQKPPLEAWNREPLSKLADRVAADPLTRRLLELMRDEDLGPAGRDVTAMSMPGGAGTRPGRFAVRAREPLVAAGLALLPPLFRAFGADLRLENRVEDGAVVAEGAELAVLEGAVGQVVSAERSVLNLLGRLSGVATNTRDHVAALPAPPAARLYDTRKTTPGLRLAEKYAVRCGGGCCHRFGLHDAVMIKDNHAASAGGPGAFGRFVAECAAAARRLTPVPAFVEVEVDRVEQFRAVLGLDDGLVDVVLLDNMPPEVMSACAAERDAARPGLYLEASGGITLGTIGRVARSGVDRISIGALTRDARTVDIGLDAVG